MPPGPDCEMASVSGMDPDEVRSDASHWSLVHDRTSLSRDISTVSGVEDGYAHALTLRLPLVAAATCLWAAERCLQ